MKKICILSVFTFVFQISCGSDRKKSVKPEDEKATSLEPSENTSLEPSENVGNKDALFLVMGGWNSCLNRDTSAATGISDMFDDGITKIAEQKWGRKTTLFFTCFDSTASKFYFERSDSDEGVLRLTMNEVLAEVAEFYNNNDVTLHIAGHSYGAYYAIRMVAMAIKTLRVHQLLTFDAISPIDCSPEKLEACTEFPRDISQPTLNEIKSSVGSWNNFYVQDALNILHSSEVAQAINHKIPVNIDSVLNAHMHVFGKPETWDLVAKIVTQSR